MPWGVAAAAAIGGMFGMAGQSRANRTNVALSREQMRFQERMSNTAYQRAASDLEAAGLNRVLGIASPSSSPAGARPTVENEMAPLQRGIEGAVSSAMQKKRLDQELDNMKAVADNTRADTELKDSAMDVNIEQIQNLRAQRRTELSNYVRNMIGAQNQIVNTALTQQYIPGATAEANLWRTLESMSAEEFAKATGISLKLAPSVMMALRMFMGGKGKGK